MFVKGLGHSKGVIKSDKEVWWAAKTSGAITQLFSFWFLPFVNTVFPSFISDGSINVTVSRHLLYGGSHWQMLFGNSCS